MGLTSLSNIRPGMVLAGDVKDRNGRTLLTAGQEIEEKHLKIFKMWGVTEVEIRGNESEDAAAQPAIEVDPAIYQAAEQCILVRFRHSGTQHTALRELAKLAAMRKAKEMKKGAS